MKKISLGSLLLLVVMIGLAFNSVRQHYSLRTMTISSSHQYLALMYSQVQVMDRMFEVNRGLDASLLLSDPDAWLDPLKKTINSNSRKIDILKSIAFRSFDQSGNEYFTIYCNPVNDDLEPYEVFDFYFRGEECTEIKRRALMPW